MLNTLLELAQLVRWINQQGWSPATSTNYSQRDLENTTHCYVSRSGVDKSHFESDDFLPMDLDGNIDASYSSVKPSAETNIHLMLFKQTDCNTILHTHSKADTLLSRLLAKVKVVQISDYELLKGIRNIDTHESTISIPVFANNQDITALSAELSTYLNANPNTQGFLIESHGFYTWGRSISEAKRHLEVFQFLFDCELTLKLAHH